MKNLTKYIEFSPSALRKINGGGWGFGIIDLCRELFRANALENQLQKAISDSRDIAIAEDEKNNTEPQVPTTAFATSRKMLKD